MIAISSASAALSASLSTAAVTSSLSSASVSGTPTAADSSKPTDEAEVVSTDPAGNVETHLSLIIPPPYTSTVWSAYKAPGVNTTTTTVSTKGYVPPTTSTTSTATTTTTTHTDPAAWATAKGVPSNILTACRIDGKNNTWGPFCSPDTKQDLWVGYTYAFTWNGDLFPLNATNRIQLRYNDTTLGNATITEPVPSYQGYANITFDDAWLKGADGNSSWSGQNLTVVMLSQPKGDVPEIVSPGPLIYLDRNPKTLPKIPIPKISNKYGLEIGLPIGLAALLIIIFSLCCAVRRNNRRFADLKGMATKDYMSKRARRGRGGRGQPLDEMELGNKRSEGMYTDQPVIGGENAFRDEIKRQREEDDALRRNVTSY